MSRDWKWLMASAGVVAKRPDLWKTAAGVVRRHAPNRWWSHAPFLPLPDSGWMDFRFETAFADSKERPDREQLIEYLEWSRSWNYL